MRNIQSLNPFLSLLRRTCLALILAFLLLPSTSTSAQSNGSLSGRVTNSNGEPILDVVVTLYGSTEYDTRYYTTTNANGEYTFPNVLPYTYLLRFSSPSIAYRNEYYNNQKDPKSANKIVVTAGAVLTGYDAVLPNSGRIVGTVVNADANPIANVQVTSYYLGPMDVVAEDTTETDSSGVFTVEVQYDGFHYLYFDPNEDYFPEFFDNKQEFADAARLVVDAEETITVAVTLSHTYSISGTVVDEHGAPAADADVQLYYRTWDGWYPTTYTVKTDSNGTYRFEHLPGQYSGLEYKLYFGGSLYLEEYYPDKDQVDDATIINLANGPEVVIVNAEITRRGVVTGTVTNQQNEPLEGINVSFYHEFHPGDWRQIQGDVTNENGQYQISGDPDFEVRLKFEGGEPSEQAYAPEYYNDVAVIEDAQPIIVPAATIIPNINAQLSHYSVITGTVTDIAGVPIAGAWISAYASDKALENSNSDYYTRTNAAGNYRLLVPPKLGLKLQFQASDYRSEFYDNQPLAENALTIVAPVNGVVPNINAQLDRRGIVTGTITTVNGTPPPYVYFQPFWNRNGTGEWDQVSQSIDGVPMDASGNYTWSLPFAGEYKFRFYHPDYLYGYYDVQPTLESATPVDIQLNTVTPNINVTMLLPGEVLAHFRGTPRSGVDSLTTTFLDRSLGPVTSRSWDFGDGTTSTETSPTHHYAELGVYTVTLTVTGSENVHTETKTDYILVGDITDVGIQQGAPGGNPNAQPSVGETLYFSATATGSNVEFLWDFGDGALTTASTATGQYVQHAYTTPGDYTVTLTASNGADEEVTTMALTVQDEEDAPISALVLNAPSSALVNSSVAFSATATGDNITYAWDFGDGGVGTGNAVSHLFSTVGTYTVTLTASNSQGEVKTTKQITVQDDDPSGEEPVSALTLDAPSSALVNSIVAFSATATGDNITYAWDFGDDGVGTGKEVSHTYTAAGTYTITLTASNTQGEVEATSKIVVTNYNLRLPNLQR